MTTVVLGPEEVRRALPYSECIPAVDAALRQLARGNAQQPLRSILRIPGGDGLLASMPATVGEPAVVGSKLLSVVPSNRERGLPSHRGVVVLFDRERGAPVAILDAATVTEVRTASVSAVAARALARPEAGVLGILGSGTQAEAHAEAIPSVRPVERVLLWDRRVERARSLARRLAERMTVPVEVRPEAESVVRSAEILCTTTSSPTPLVRGTWLSPGVHVNAVGAVGPGVRELDSDAVVRSRLFVDLRRSALAEAEEVRVPLAEGTLRPEQLVGELGEVLVGTVPGRRSADEVTLFKSVGLAVEDLSAAQRAYERATSLGIGTRVEFS